MPLLLDKKSSYDTRLAVWKVEEPNDYFLAALNLSPEERAKYEGMKLHRQKEWLSSRYLLHYISGDKSRTAIVKTDKGKPYRQGCEKHISISHSKEYTAAIISSRTVGIDIQKEEPKIGRIAHKFLADSEAARLPTKQLLKYHHVFWGGKEAMYKAYGLKELEFKDHMYLFPFVWNEQSHIEVAGWVRKQNINQNYNINVECLEDTFLIYVQLEKEE